MSTTKYDALQFEAMGVDIELIVEMPQSASSQQALQRGSELVHEYAARCTRFDHSSELMQLNQSRSGVVSPQLFEVVQAARDAALLTSGRFDPTLAQVISDLGYDKTWEQLSSAHARPENPCATSSTAALSRPIWNFEALVLDQSNMFVQLPPDTFFDLGGIAKGFIADRVVHDLSQLAPTLANIGGDIACSQAANSTGWSIEVEHLPVGNSRGAHRTFDLPHGAVATSGINRRSWRVTETGSVMHHIINPITRLPHAGELSAVSVVAGTAAAAEAISTALMFSSVSELESDARRYNVQVLATTTDGHVLEY